MNILQKKRKLSISNQVSNPNKRMRPNDWKSNNEYHWDQEYNNNYTENQPPPPPYNNNHFDRQQSYQN